MNSVTTEQEYENSHKPLNEDDSFTRSERYQIIKTWQLEQIEQAIQSEDEKDYTSMKMMFLVDALSLKTEIAYAMRELKKGFNQRMDYIRWEMWIGRLGEKMSGIVEHGTHLKARVARGEV